MSIIIENFWLICGLWIGIGNAVYFRVKLKKAIQSNRITAQEVNHFTITIILGLTIPCIAFWIIQIAGAKATTPFITTWPEPYRTIAISITILIWILALAWILFLGGARYLSKMCILANHQTNIWKHPIAFKIAIIFLIAVGTFSLMKSDDFFKEMERESNQQKEPTETITSPQ